MFYRTGLEINWKVPLLFNNDRLAISLLMISEKLGIKKPFSTVYGSPNNVLAGGRNSIIKNEMSESEIIKYFKTYKNFGVKCALTLSRMDISNTNLNDNYLNSLLSLLNQFFGSVIVSNDYVLDYIKNKYENLQVCASVIKPIYDKVEDEDIQYYIKLLKKYDRIVPRPEIFIKGDCYMGLIPYSDCIDILVNQTCLYDCKFACAHYKHYEKMEEGYDDGFVTPCQGDKHKLSSINKTVSMDYLLITHLMNYGFKSFKLQGRNLPVYKILSYLGAYIYEPTGDFRFIESYILNNKCDDPINIDNIVIE